jgi:hypothetical protein
VKSIETEIRVVDAKLDSARKAAAQVVPRIHPIKPPDIPGIRETITAVNQLFRIVHDALTGLGKAVARLGQGITEPFETAGENMKKEFQKVDYKRAVAWELLDRFWSDTTELFNKFWWFLVGLVLWLTASYALWVRRRLAVGWALLCNRETVQ